MLTKGINVTLVDAQNAVRMPNASKTNAIIVAIGRDGRVFLETGWFLPPRSRIRCVKP